MLVEVDSKVTVDERAIAEAKSIAGAHMKALDYESEGGLEKGVEVSAVIPSKDEEETIGVCIDKIRKVFDSSGIVGEIIVSDSSEDRTPIIAKNLGAKVVVPDKKGYGYAYTFAFKSVKGKYVVIGDADDTYDFARAGEHVSIVKIVELIGSSPDGWKEATEKALKEAAKTVRNIKSLHVKRCTAKVANNKIVEYRAVVKVAFAVKREI